MKRLYVLFDGECSLCGRCRAWLARQPAFLELCFLPFQSTEVSRRFPGIESLHPEEQLLVVSDEGGVYQGPRAWVMCLYALRDYREWSQRLAHPALLPWARRICELLSENRLQVSRWLDAPICCPHTSPLCQVLYILASRGDFATFAAAPCSRFHKSRRPLPAARSLKTRRFR